MNDGWTKNVKSFTVKENEAFRMRVESWKCKAPEDLNNVDFIQESITDGKVTQSSTYNFFMTDAEIKTLAEGLLK